MRNLGVVCLLSIVAGCSLGRSDEPLGKARAPLWTALPKMTTARESLALAPLDGKRLLVTGGVSREGVEQSSAEIYDHDKRTFTAVAPMGSTRAAHRATRLSSGKILVTGGTDAADKDLSTAEIYDPATNTWTATAPMHRERSGHEAVALKDGSVLVTSGHFFEAEIFDPATATWTAVGSMHDARWLGVSVLLDDGRVLVAGGMGISGRAEIFDPKARTFSQIGDPFFQHRQMVVAVRSDGKLLIGGGGETPETADDKTWILDVSAGSVVPGPAFPEKRIGASLVRLASGQLLLAGGEESGRTRLFDGTSWTDSGFLQSRRYDAEAFHFGDDSVLLLGGKVSQLGFGDHTDLAELWTSPGGPVDAGTAVTPPTAVGGSFARCRKDAECSTGHCVDGVCCNTACTDRCHSCALPSSPGICTEEPVGVDLRAECGSALSCTGTCGPGGVCIGSVKGALCAKSTCTSATGGVGPATCTTAGGACPVADALTFECAPYTCEPAFGACRSTCAASTDCAGGFVCDTASRTCVPNAPPSDDSGGCAFSGRAHASVLGLVMALAAIARARRSRQT